MRQIIRQHEIVDDDVRYPGDSRGGMEVFALAPFLAAMAAPDVAAHPRAVQLEPQDDAAALAPYLRSLALIVVHFPKIGEGRGYTQARLLRQRFGYSGELRARGALRRDQLFFLARCGFDAFDLASSENLAEAVQALGSFSVIYQHTGGELIARMRR